MYLVLFTRPLAFVNKNTLPYRTFSLFLGYIFNDVQSCSIMFQGTLQQKQNTTHTHRPHVNFPGASRLVWHLTSSLRPWHHHRPIRGFCPFPIAGIISPFPGKFLTGMGNHTRFYAFSQLIFCWFINWFLVWNGVFSILRNVDSKSFCHQPRGSLNFWLAGMGWVPSVSIPPDLGLWRGTNTISETIHV